MIRRRRRGKLLRDEHEEDISPMEGTSNLTDAMLVLAVGIMLAMVTNWNVDLFSKDGVKELKNAETLTDEEVREVESDMSLEEKGVVYQDPSTGRMYVKVE